MNTDPAMRHFFGEGHPVFHASAPGRLDVMGGIADYSGSFVLQMPLAVRTDVYLAPRTDGVLRAHSVSAAEAGLIDTVETDLQTLLSHGASGFDPAFRKALASEPEQAWTAYVFGCVIPLILEHRIDIRGVDFWVDSKVPIGKGVSSSAALEVAVLSALREAYAIDLPGNELPVLAQKIENRIVGAPCGLMDQLASYFGRAHQLLPILCQPDRVEATVGIPERIHFIGVDSGCRHAVSGSSYTDVRTAAFMGYTLIARHLGASAKDILSAKQTGNREALPFAGYLANVTPVRFEEEFAGLLPECLRGSVFLDTLGDTIDSVTAVRPDRTYAVRDCTAHPVYENYRVRRFADELASIGTGSPEREPEICVRLGEWMYESHESYSRCGLGSEATDALVQQARQAGPERGVYGAKITGGGGGGTVCFLGLGETGRSAIQDIAREHAARFGCEMTVFDGSSEGAKYTEVEQVG